MSRRNEIIARIQTVPSIPTVIAKIEQMLNNPDVSFKALSDLIKYEPGLTANILKIANSAYFGFKQKISSVQQAIVRLGTERVHELAIASSLAPIAHSSVKGYDLPAGELWKHSILIALGGEQIAKMKGIKPPDSVFTTGLLLDIGKIVLGTFVEIDVNPIMDLAFKKKIPFDVAERRVLGIDHTEVGAILLKNWNLPEEIVNTVRWHHQPSRAKQNSLLLDLVHSANIFAMISGIGTGSDGLNYRPDKEVMKRMNFTTEKKELVISMMMTGLNDVQDLLSLGLPDKSKK